MIRHLELSNYRSHEHTSFDLEPLTVFIGPVAGGKSNIFRGLQVLRLLVRGKAPEEAFGYPAYFASHRHRGERSANAPIGFKVCVDQLGEGFPEDEAAYSVWVNEGAEGEVIAEERLERFRPQSGEPGQVIFARKLRTDLYGEFGEFGARDQTILGAARRMEKPDSEDVRFAAAVASQLLSFGYHHLDAYSLREPGSMPREPGQSVRMSWAGRNLTSALAAWRDDPEAEQVYRDLEDRLKDVVPDLERFVLAPTSRTDHDTQLEFVHRGFIGRLAAIDESDGTLYTLGLLAVIHQPDQPAILAIEEPETGLHPGRLRWLVDELWDLAHGRIGAHPVQVLVSTHSPYLLDLFHDLPEVVRVVTREEGRTAVVPLLEAVGKYGITREQLREAPLGDQWYAGLFEGARACG